MEENRQIQNGPRGISHVMHSEIVRKSVAQMPVTGHLIDILGPHVSPYVFISIGALALTFGYIYCNQNNFNFVQVTLSRGISMLIFFGICIKYLGYSVEYKSPYNFWILFKRNMCMVIHGFIFAFAQFYLPLSIVHTINSTGPLFAFVFDFFIFGIKQTRKQIIGIFIGLAGLILVVNGAIIMKYFDPQYHVSTHFKHYKSTDTTVRLLVAGLQICGTIIWAYAIMLTKTFRGVNPFQVNLHFGLLLIFSSGLVYPALVEVQVDWTKFLFSIPFATMIMSIGQFFYTSGLSIAKNTGKVSIVSFVSVIAGYGLSVFRYGQAVNIVCIIGAILILIGIHRVLW